jgi:hypothetical protein
MLVFLIVYEKERYISILSFFEVKKKTSKFVGVSRNQGKWLAQVKNKNGGRYDNERDAAMRVNLLCDMFMIPRKNPSIDFELQEQVIHSLSIVY